MSKFDIESLLDFQPAMYWCPSCFGLITNFNRNSLQNWVAYLLAADKYFRLLLIRLDGGTQPVSLTQNGFSKPRPYLLACI
jgi:hypothetical protein